MQRFTTKTSLLRRHRLLNKGAKRFRRTNFSRASTHAKFSYSRSTTALLLGTILGTVGYVLLNNDTQAHGVDYQAVREEIVKVLNDEHYDDGSYGPVFVRLAWHASGTYSKHDGTGGSNGATMRFNPEANWGANAGLKHARDRLEVVKKKFPGISYADLWTLAGVVAVEEMGGPKIQWKPGRKDAPDNKGTAPDGRLPDADKGSDHIRNIFYRMGFNDQEIVALLGAHSVGRMHKDRSGYDGPWTNAPTTFSNDYYVQLKERKWNKQKWNGPEQYRDETGQIVMAPADLALLSDPSFRKYVDLYAENEEKFFEDFAKAFSKLLELGVKF